MRLALFLPLALTGALLLAACAPSPPDPAVARADPRDPDPPDVSLEDEPVPEDVVSAVGVVTYVDLEGGFYGIVVGDSARYNPTNLDPEFQEDGLEVRFRGRIQEDVMTIQMWGQPIELIEIMRMWNEEEDE